MNTRLRPVWTADRLSKLENLLQLGRSNEQIAKALGVSVCAVKRSRRRYGIMAAYRTCHTGRQVARILGTDPNGMAVARWIKDGRLKARKGAPYGAKKVWRITEEDLLTFLDNPAHWHCWRPENITDPNLRSWTMELRGHVRFITVKEAISRLGKKQTAVWNMIRRGKLPVSRDGGAVWVWADEPILCG